MKCDICEKEVANSEELKAHMERDHPVKDGDDGAETPDPTGTETEKPEPIFRPVR